MKKTRKCAFCGREFTANRRTSERRVELAPTIPSEEEEDEVNSGVQKYCSVSCADEAKRERKSAMTWL